MNPNITELEYTLGRPLNWAEINWVKLTDGVEDFHLYCVTIILLLVFYPLANLPYLILEQIKHPFFEQYRIQGGSYNSNQSVWECFKDVMTTIVVVVGPLQVLSYPFFKV